MAMDRKSFLTIMGLGAAGTLITGKSKELLFAEESNVLPEENFLKAKTWAMVIDLKKCQEKENCTKCMDACHSVHNVPKIDNPKHEIKWIWKEKYKYSFPMQHNDNMKEGVENSDVTLLCNHCDNPPCVRVCPTQATWKRTRDGIVMMDMHRCIGCRFCMAACPYGSRSFNWINPKPHIKKINKEFPIRMRGVVEKCNFCADRLSRGQIPACVEACEKEAKAKAMVFGDVTDKNSEVRKLLSENYTIRRKPSLGTGPRVYYIV